MKHRFAALATISLAAAALAMPAVAANPDRVTQECTSFGSLPPGPPPKVGQVTVTPPTGLVITPPLVPAPCSAPGWLKNNPPD